MWAGLASNRLNKTEIMQNYRGAYYALPAIEHSGKRKAIKREWCPGVCGRGGGRMKHRNLFRAVSVISTVSEPLHYTLDPVI